MFTEIPDRPKRTGSPTSERTLWVAGGEGGGMQGRRVNTTVKRLQGEKVMFGLGAPEQARHQLASPRGDTFLQDTHWDTSAYHGAVRDALLVWRSWFSLETLTDLH